jgi:hypothetical protein
LTVLKCGLVGECVSPRSARLTLLADFFKSLKVLKAFVGCGVQAKDNGDVILT